MGGPDRPEGNEVDGSDVRATVGWASAVGDIVAVGGSSVGDPVRNDADGDDEGAEAGVGVPAGNSVAVAECVGGSVGEHVPVVRWQLHSREPRTYADAAQGQPSKAWSPMYVTESGITTVARLLQPKKACWPMYVTESGIPNVARLVHSEKT